MGQGGEEWGRNWIKVIKSYLINSSYKIQISTKGVSMINNTALHYIYESSRKAVKTVNLELSQENI